MIALAAEVFSTCEVTIEESRRYGPTLLVHGMETARAIRLCLGKDIPGPAFALARALNEAVLRGHVILHEISLTELNELLARTGANFVGRKNEFVIHRILAVCESSWMSGSSGKREGRIFPFRGGVLGGSRRPGARRGRTGALARWWQDAPQGNRRPLLKR